MKYSEDTSVDVRMGCRIGVIDVAGQEHDITMSLEIDRILTAPKVVRGPIEAQDLMPVRDLPVNDQTSVKAQIY